MKLKRRKTYIYKHNDDDDNIDAWLDLGFFYYIFLLSSIFACLTRVILMGEHDLYILMLRLPTKNSSTTTKKNTYTIFFSLLSINLFVKWSFQKVIIYFWQKKHSYCIFFYFLFVEQDLFIFSMAKGRRPRGWRSAKTFFLFIFPSPNTIIFNFTKKLIFPSSSFFVSIDYILLFLKLFSRKNTIS